MTLSLSRSRSLAWNGLVAMVTWTRSWPTQSLQIFGPAVLINGQQALVGIQLDLRNPIQHTQTPQGFYPVLHYPLASNGFKDRRPTIRKVPWWISNIVFEIYSLPSVSPLFRLPDRSFSTEIRLTCSTPRFTPIANSKQDMDATAFPPSHTSINFNGPRKDINTMGSESAAHFLAIVMTMHIFTQWLSDVIPSRQVWS